MQLGHCVSVAFDPVCRRWCFETARHTSQHLNHHCWYRSADCGLDMSSDLRKKKKKKKKSTGVTQWSLNFQESGNTGIMAGTWQTMIFPSMLPNGLLKPPPLRRRFKFHYSFIKCRTLWLFLREWMCSLMISDSFVCVWGTLPSHPSC